ncbi:uncharacterized protein EI90DRAFT_3011536 [Cantharellus anzutake]|uniref:uncharacterized protein n=1 Tax=Cantharellus anzutake TaxID=1750568 RepID=UPI0019046058|nr:uncharacterized protein EI90DRAFT_3011536 [Cantharellus anzutake]KAF8343164.1 hypothetical protein EI90DRAFT_3011536 [Cantharellus anzutake]
MVGKGSKILGGSPGVSGICYQRGEGGREWNGDRRIVKKNNPDGKSFLHLHGNSNWGEAMGKCPLSGSAFEVYRRSLRIVPDFWCPMWQLPQLETEFSKLLRIVLQCSLSTRSDSPRLRLPSSHPNGMMPKYQCLGIWVARVRSPTTQPFFSRIDLALSDGGFIRVRRLGAMMEKGLIRVERSCGGENTENTFTVHRQGHPHGPKEI